jgi:Fe-S cluster assembly iron-binding protein IscA
VTPEALAVIRNSLQVAQADPNAVGIRLRIAGGEVRPQFVTEPRDDDEVTVVEGMRVFIARAIVDDLGDVVVDATEEHGNLIVRMERSDSL